NQSGEALTINGATTRVWRYGRESQYDAVQVEPVAADRVSAQSASRDALSTAVDAAALPREARSRDGRFALFNASAGGARQDVFIAAAPSTASGLVWTNLINCSAKDNNVQKTSGINNADDASATSLQSIAAGNAFVEFTAFDTDKERFCGLSNSNA